MHLSDYMNAKRLNDEQVADIIGVTRATVSRIRRRKVRPDWGTIEKLKAWSRGKMTADDFQELESAQ